MVPYERLVSLARAAALQWPRTRRELVAWQNKRLRRLIAHAHRSVPYYRRLMDRHGLRPADIRSVADLSAIPTTTKEDLRSWPLDDVLARGVRAERLIVRNTSGSSGMPFQIRRTWLEERVLNAIRLRANRDLGSRPRDRSVHIGLTTDAHPNDSQWSRRVLDWLGLFRCDSISCFEPPGEIIRLLRRLDPEVVYAFPGVLSLVAQQMDEDDRRVVSPRFVSTAGEVLTPLMRRTIAEAFGAPLYETYGSHEFNLIAWECRQTGQLHTCDDSVLVEVLRDGRPAAPGERGEVVATNLHAFAMPFIRYRLGDIVTRGESSCACGQPFSTIHAVQGRMVDYFSLPDGRLLHPYALTGALKRSAPWIKQHKLVQEKAGRFTFHVVPRIPASPQELARLDECAATILGPDVEFRTILVPEIQQEASGKFRYSRSLVHSHYDGIDWDSLN